MFGKRHIAHSGSRQRGLEPVAAGADGIHGGILFHSQEFHALRLGCRLAGLGHAGGVFRRHIDRRAGVRWNRNFHRQLTLLAPPLAADAAVNGIVVRLDPRQVAHQRRLDEDFFEPYRGRVALDAGDFFIKPDDEIAHQHDVVAGIHRRIGGVAVPQLPHRRRAVPGHVAPAGIRRVRGETIDQVRPAAVGEHAVDPLAADQTGAKGGLSSRR